MCFIHKYISSKSVCKYFAWSYFLFDLIKRVVGVRKLPSIKSCFFDESIVAFKSDLFRFEIWMSRLLDKSKVQDPTLVTKPDIAKSINRH